MYRIILIDDEPLILAGIASLIRWEDYDCTIIGKSTIPTEARQMILEMQPDIVITDIRMPVLNGLDLVESCKKEGAVFSFILLTNLEEFSLAKKAMSLGAIDYLVKLNLKPEELISTLDRAKKGCDLMRKSRNLAGFPQTAPPPADQVRRYLSQTARLVPLRTTAGKTPLFSCFPSAPITSVSRQMKTAMTSVPLPDSFLTLWARFQTAILLIPCILNMMEKTRTCWQHP